MDALDYVFEAVFAALTVLAATIDARERRLPNALAAALCALGAACAISAASVSGPSPLSPLLRHLLAAAAVCGALVLLELLWRARRGSAGVGMGDVKLLLALMLVDPVRGILAFAGGLVLLAIACLIARRPSLPLIPFLAPVWIALLAIRWLGSPPLP